PPTATAGVPFDVMFTLLDRFGNVATGATVPYTHTIRFTSTDSLATLPADYTFQQSYPNDAGTRVFTATLMTPGHQTITATDTTTQTITGTLDVTVRPGPTASLKLDTPPNATMGQSFDFTLTLLDRFGNVATGAAVRYTGTIHFTSTDALATLPSDYTFQQSYSADSGTRSFSASLVTPGRQTIAATDTAKASITGTSPSIQVLVPSVGLPPP